jgi:hypothetical protein
MIKLGTKSFIALAPGRILWKRKNLIIEMEKKFYKIGLCLFILGHVRVEQKALSWICDCWRTYCQQCGQTDSDLRQIGSKKNSLGQSGQSGKKMAQ